MGKSGCFFFATKDNRFMIKTIKPDEVKVLKNLVLDLYNYITFKNPNSLLTRIYGFYEISIEGFDTFPVIIMENSYYQMSQEGLVKSLEFDLKGSLIGRATDKSLVKRN